jgi:serine/threonine protein kinase
MTTQSSNVEALFSAALNIAAPLERAAFLDQSCGNNAELRTRVEALLQADADAGSFLEKPILESGQTNSAMADETDGDRYGKWTTELSFLKRTEKPGCLGVLKGAANEYEFIELVGQGGMGAVFRAWDVKLGRIVAVKVMAPVLAANPMAVKRFLREAKAAAAVHHDNVVTIHAIDETHEPPFLVMEFIEGTTLSQKIERQGALEVVHVLRIGSQIAAGLAAAHKLGLTHRDIKPANILLQNGVERVKITDFGLARAGDDMEITQTGMVAGTPQYMSPEQANGESIDSRSDLFSLGSVMYAMCTGRPAFRAETTLGVLRRVCDDTPRPIHELNPDIPRWLEAVVSALHRKLRVERIQSAAELSDLLSQYLAHAQNPAEVSRPPTVVVRALHPRPIERTPRFRRFPRNRLFALAAGICLITAATLLVTTFWQSFFNDDAATQGVNAVEHASSAEPTTATTEVVTTPKETPQDLATDLLQPGTVWSGSRTYRKGSWAGKTVTYDLHVRERAGSKLTGHVFDNGPTRNRAELEGEIKGDTITWREKTLYPNNHINVRARLEGRTITLTLQGEHNDGSIYTEGDGRLILTASK